MYIKYLKGLSYFTGVSFFLRFVNFIKIFLILNLSGFSSDINYFFYICGIVYPVYFFVESVLQAEFIPYFIGLGNQRKKIYSSFFYVFSSFSIVFSIVISKISFFRITGKLDFIILFNLIMCSGLLKILYEADGRFVFSTVIDLISSVIFILLIFFGIRDFIKILIISELFKLLIKYFFMKEWLIKLRLEFDFLKNESGMLYIIAGGAFISNLVVFLDNRLLYEIPSGVFIFTSSMFVASAAVSFLNSIFSAFNLNVISENKDNRKNVIEYMEKSTGCFLTVIMYIGIFLIANSRELIQLFFINKSVVFNEFNLIIIQCFKLSIVYIPIFLLEIIFIRYFNAVRKNLFLVFTAIINFMIHFIFIYFFIDSMGVMSVILARIISGIVCIGIFLRKIEHKIDLFRFIDRRVVINCILLIIILHFFRTLDILKLLLIFSVFLIYSGNTYVWFFWNNRK